MKSILQNKTVQAIVAVILLAIIGILMTIGLEQAMDIFFLDETAYLVRGTNMFEKIPKRWGPLYCTWYKGLSLIEGNLIQLFYLNFKLMAILPAMVLFLALRKYSETVIFSFFIAACFLISGYNLTVDPKVSFFCVTIICFALWMSAYTQKPFFKWLVFLSGTLLMSFARPEFYMAFLLILVGGLGYFALKKENYKKQNLIPFALFVAAALVLHLGLGNPLMVKLGGHNRSLIAFGEHFAYNYAQWNQSELYAWLAWEEIVKKEFGEVASVSDVIQSNFALFWKHVATNIGHFFKSFFGLVLSMFIPVKIKGILVYIFGILLSVYFLYYLIKEWKKAPIELWYLLLLAIPTLISCVLVYPRNHYLVLLVPVLALLFVSAFSFLKDDDRIAMPMILIIGAFFIFLGPRADDFKYFEIRKEEGVLNNRRAIDMLDQIKLEDSVSVLSNEGDFSAFLKQDLSWISAIDKKREPFNTFLMNTQPDVIYVTETMNKNPYYFEDEHWQSFTKEYASFGYELVNLAPHMKEYFLVKTNLISHFQ
jgi:hypothetical protein